MLLTPFDAGQKALPEVREIMPIVRVEILLVDKKIHKRAVLARQVAIQVRLDLLRPMRIEDDIVLDKDDILLRVHPKIPLGGMEGLLPGEVIRDVGVSLRIKNEIAVQYGKAKIPEGAGRLKIGVGKMLRRDAIHHLWPGKAQDLSLYQLPLLHHRFIACVLIRAIGKIGAGVDG